jgi:hypothetical protein
MHLYTPTPYRLREQRKDARKAKAAERKAAAANTSDTPAAAAVKSSGSVGVDTDVRSSVRDLQLSTNAVMLPGASALTSSSTAPVAFQFGSFNLPAAAAAAAAVTANAAAAAAAASPVSATAAVSLPSPLAQQQQQTGR